MMGIIVQRQPADKSGEDIINSVLTTVEAQVEAGTYYINHNMDDRVTYSGSKQGVAFIQPGTMVTVDNKGIIKKGLLTKYSGRISIGSSIEITTQVTIETIK